METAAPSTQDRRLETGIVLAAVFGFSIVAGLNLARGLVGATVAIVAVGTLAVAAGRLGSQPALAVSVLVLLIAAAGAVVGLWPLPLLIAVGAYLLIARRRAGDQLPTSGLRRGRLDRSTWVLVAAAVAVAVVGLGVWAALVSDSRTRAVDDSLTVLALLPIWSWPVIGLAFATVNAAAEEAVYRGVFQEALSAVTGAAPAVVLQAAAFGLLHYGGFPSGAVGVALSAVFGLLLGIVRVRSNGLLAPWIAHIAADLAVVTLAITLLA